MSTSYLGQTGGLFCCSNRNPDYCASPSLNTTENINFSEIKDKKLRVNTSNGNDNIKLLCEWTLPFTGTQEEIIFSGFIEDINPDFLIVVTRDIDLGNSKFYILRVK